MRKPALIARAQLDFDSPAGRLVIFLGYFLFIGFFVLAGDLLIHGRERYQSGGSTMEPLGCVLKASLAMLLSAALWTWMLR